MYLYLISVSNLREITFPEYCDVGFLAVYLTSTLLTLFTNNEIEYLPDEINIIRHDINSNVSYICNSQVLLQFSEDFE